MISSVAESITVFVSRRRKASHGVCKSCGQPVVNSKSTPSSPNRSISYPISRQRDVPLGAELDNILNTITEARSDIGCLDDEIARVRSVLARLKLERANREKDIRGQQSFITPAGQLPAEILGDIFLYSTTTVTYDTNMCPWVLGRVCSYWRAIVLTLPQLWSSVDVRLDIMEKIQFPAHHSQRLLDICLRRSGQRRLTFHLKSGRAISPHYPRYMINSAFFRSSYRWEDASFDIRSEVHRKALRLLKSNAMPLLKSLSLSFGHSPFHDIVDAFEVVPQLSRLSLVRIINPTLCMKLPWSQLTSIVLTNPVLYAGEYFDMLNRTPNLVEFEIDFSHQTMIDTSMGSVQLRHLRKLTIRASHREMSQFLRPLGLPNLDELRLSFSAFEPLHHDGGADCIVALFLRSSCSLTRFYADGLEEHELIRVVEECLNLTHLCCRNLCLSMSLVRRLTPRAAKVSCLLPNLQTLALDIAPHSTANANDLLIMIKSRLRDRTACRRQAPVHVARLRHVWLRVKLGRLGVINKLRALRGEGLVMEINGTNEGPDVWKVWDYA